MRNLTVREQAHRTSVQEIRGCASVQVDFDHEGMWGVRLDGSRFIFDGLPAWDGVILSPELEDANVSVSGLASCWHTVDTPRRLDGEFQIKDLFDCLMGKPPELGWDGSLPEDLQLFSEFRVIDDTPRAANGLLAAIRVRSGADPLEIWYYDKDLSRSGTGRDCLRMDVDYSGYLDALLLTKGTFGWQYLAGLGSSASG